MTPTTDELPDIVARVVPRCGDALVFPHGRHRGCHPDPLHEGSEVLAFGNSKDSLESLNVQFIFGFILCKMLVIRIMKIHTKTARIKLNLI